MARIEVPEGWTVQAFRLSRVGFGWFDVLLGLQGRRKVVADAATEERARSARRFRVDHLPLCGPPVRAAVGATQDR